MMGKEQRGYVGELERVTVRGGGGGREKSPNEVRNDVMLLYTLFALLLLLLLSNSLSSHFLFSDFSSCFYP